MSAISDKYQAMGGKEGFLGEAKGSEQVCPDGVGRHQHFKGGSIHWSPGTDAHITRSFIQKKWQALGWEVGFLGYPVTDESDCAGGKFNEFQAGTISWRAGTKQAFETHGSIRDKWVALGRESGLLGFPETDETATPDKRGRFTHFQHGSIYWTKQTGAHEVHGAIRDHWAKLGWERSFLGYPTSDERPTADKKGRYNEFEGGTITWTRDGGTREEQRSSFRPRLVTAIGHATIVDHETVGSNERLTVPVKVAQTVRSMNARQPFMRFKRGHGGEVRFEVDLDVVITPNDVAVLEGEARLYEGTSESTNQLRDRRPIRITVEPDQVKSTTENTSKETLGSMYDLAARALGEDISDKGEMRLRVYNLIA